MNFRWYRLIQQLQRFREAYVAKTIYSNRKPLSYTSAPPLLLSNQKTQSLTSTSCPFGCDDADTTSIKNYQGNMQSGTLNFLIVTLISGIISGKLSLMIQILSAQPRDGPSLMAVVTISYGCSPLRPPSLFVPCLAHWIRIGHVGH